MIWTISKGVYRYLRQNRILPLPSERLLEQKINHIKLPPGFLDNIADILRTKAAILSERNRAVHLSFDEVKQIFKAISDSILKKYMILGFFHINRYSVTLSVKCYFTVVANRDFFQGVIALTLKFEIPQVKGKQTGRAVDSPNK